MWTFSPISHPGRIRAKGPMSAPLAIELSTRTQLWRMMTRSPTVQFSQHAVGPDGRVGANACLAEQLHEGLDDGVRVDFDFGVDDAGFGPVDGDTGCHEPPRCGHAHGCVKGDEFGDGVRTEDFGGIFGLDGDDALALFAQDAGHVGEIELGGGIVGLQFGQVRFESGRS